LTGFPSEEPEKRRGVAPRTALPKQARYRTAPHPVTYCRRYHFTAPTARLLRGVSQCAGPRQRARTSCLPLPQLGAAEHDRKDSAPIRLLVAAEQRLGALPAPRRGDVLERDRIERGPQEALLPSPATDEYVTAIALLFDAISLEAGDLSQLQPHPDYSVKVRRGVELIGASLELVKHYAADLRRRRARGAIHPAPPASRGELTRRGRRADRGSGCYEPGGFSRRS